jgi:hypothetical protein
MNTSVCFGVMWELIISKSWDNIQTHNQSDQETHSPVSY